MSSGPAHADAEACRDRDGRSAVKDVVRELVRVAKQGHAQAEPAGHLELRPGSESEGRTRGRERSTRASLHRSRAGTVRSEPANESRGARTRRQVRPAPSQGTSVEVGCIERERRCASGLGKVRAPDVRTTKDQRRRPRSWPIERGGHVDGDPGQDGGGRPEDDLSLEGNTELPPQPRARHRHGLRRRRGRNRRWCRSLGGRTFARRSRRWRRAGFRRGLWRALLGLLGALPGIRARRPGTSSMDTIGVGWGRSAELGIQGHRDDQRHAVRRFGTSPRNDPTRRFGGAEGPENEIADHSSRMGRSHDNLCRERSLIGDLDAGRARRDSRGKVGPRGALGRSPHLQPDSCRRRLRRSVRRDGRALREERDQQGSARRHRADGSIAR